jgi:hypothetical protein
VSLIPVTNLPPVSLIPAGNFATGVIDIGGKFNTGVVGAPGLANISAEFSKKFEMTLMLFSGAWGEGDS